MGKINQIISHIPEEPDNKVEFPAIKTFFNVIDRYENVVVVKVLLPTETDYRSAGFGLRSFQRLSDFDSEDMETASNATTTSELPGFISAKTVLQQHQHEGGDRLSCGQSATSTCSQKSSARGNSLGRQVTPLLAPASDNISEYSTASDVSGAFVTPAESSPPTPDNISVVAAEPHSIRLSEMNFSGEMRRPEEITSPAPSSPSVRIPSPDISSNMSSPCVGSPNVSPVVSNDGDKIMSFGMMGLLHERLGTDFPLSYDQEADHLVGLVGGEADVHEDSGRNRDLDLLVEGLSRQSPSAFDHQQTPHCVSPVASPEPAEGAVGVDPSSPTSVFEEEDRTSSKFNLPSAKPSNWCGSDNTHQVYFNLS